MANVYLVTSGSYSDYSVDAVFSTKEKAEAWIGQDDSQYYSLEEMELDPEDPNVNPFSIRGTIYFDIADSVNTSLYPEFGGTRNYDSIRVWGGLLEMWFDGKDTEQAIKVLNEKRTQLIALNRTQPGTYHRETLEKLS